MQRGNQNSHNNCIISREVWKTHMHLQDLSNNHAISMWIFIPMLHGKHILLATQCSKNGGPFKIYYKKIVFAIFPAHESSCVPQIAKGPKNHLQDFLFNCFWSELQISPVSLRFLLFFHNFSTSQICFPHNVGINFHIKIALLLQRCEKHICIYNTSRVIMQILCECSFPRSVGSILWSVVP